MVIFDQVIKLFKYLADPNKCTVWIKAISITDHMLSPYWTIHHAWYWCMCILEMVCSMQNFGSGYLNYFEKMHQVQLNTHWDTCQQSKPFTEWKMGKTHSTSIDILVTRIHHYCTLQYTHTALCNTYGFA